jgi:hypothetical protein
MNRNRKIIVILVLGGVAGYVATLVWSSQTAGYIAGIVGAALSAVALAAGTSDRRAEIASKVRVRRVRRSNVIGVDTDDTAGSIDSDVNVGRINEGTVIGVRKRRT